MDSCTPLVFESSTPASILAGSNDANDLPDDAGASNRDFDEAARVGRDVRCPGNSRFNGFSCRTLGSRRALCVATTTGIDASQYCGWS